MSKRFFNRRHFIALLGATIGLGLSARPTMAQSALSYGVTPNAGRNQSVAFQRMLNQAALSGTAIELPAGDYKINNIRLPDGCVLRGAGASTILTNSGTGPMLFGNAAGWISLSNFRCDGAMLAATAENQGVITLSNIMNANLSGLIVRNGANDGIYLEQCGGNVSNCQISQIGRLGIFAMQSNSLALEDNTVDDCADGGIIVHRWEAGHDGAVIARNVVRNIRASRGGVGQWGNGINVFRADNVLVQDNQMSNCAFSAIRANTTENTIINRNKCIASGETAIYAEFAFKNATITRNFIDGCANGISATNLNNGGRGSVITDNTIRNAIATGPYQPAPPYFGHGISVEADALVRDNLIETVNGYGINVGWGPYLDNVEVSANTIKDANIGIGISVADGAGTAKITSNLIHARNGAIRVHRWDQIEPNDLALNPLLAPANILLDDNRIF